jgi:LPS sulfotransferase NodH
MGRGDFFGRRKNCGELTPLSDSARSCVLKNMYAGNEPIFGFETKILQEQHLGTDMVNLPLKHYIAMLEEVGFDKFVFLKRENYLKRAVSAAVGRKKNTWHSTERPDEIKIDPERYRTGRQHRTLLAHFESLDAVYDQACEFIDSSSDVLDLEYESHILPDPKIALSRILNFLDIDYHAADFQASYKRHNPYDIDEVIINLDEISGYLFGVKYEWMTDSSNLRSDTP